MRKTIKKARTKLKPMSLSIQWKITVVDIYSKSQALNEILFSSDACMPACKYRRECFSATDVKNPAI